MKNCWGCKYIKMMTAQPAYSEETPGWETEIDCTKNKWQIDIYKDNEITARKKFETAENCEFYKFYKEY